MGCILQRTPRICRDLRMEWGLGHQPLTRLCALGEAVLACGQCAPLLPAQTLQELGHWEGLQGSQGNFRDLAAEIRSERDKRGGTKHEGPRTPYGLRSPASLAPAAPTCGTGVRAHTLRRRRLRGGPRAAGAAGAAEGGRALGLAARNSAGLQGGAGRRRPAWVTASAASLSPCLGSNTFFSPSFLTQPHLSSGRRGAR